MRIPHKKIGMFYLVFSIPSYPQPVDALRPRYSYVRLHFPPHLAMPAVPWTTERQRAFIQDKVPSYCAAANEGKKAIRRFWPIAIGEFFQAFPLKQELVDSGALGGHVVADTYDLTTQESDVFQQAMEKRIGVSHFLFILYL